MIRYESVLNSLYFVNLINKINYPSKFYVYVPNVDKCV